MPTEAGFSVTQLSEGNGVTRTVWGCPNFIQGCPIGPAIAGPDDSWSESAGPATLAQLGVDWWSFFGGISSGRGRAVAVAGRV